MGYSIYGTFAAKLLTALIIMRKIFTIGLLLFTVNAFSQDVSGQDSIPRSNFPIKDTVVSDTIVDNRPRNAYGDLLNDDPAYNPHSSWPIVAFRVATTNAFNWALSRYVFNYDWARISTTTWKNNLKGGWEWDNDRFGVNFIGHPHSGNNYFNIARSNGYSFWGSYPFKFLINLFVYSFWIYYLLSVIGLLVGFFFLTTMYLST